MNRRQMLVSSAALAAAAASGGPALAQSGASMPAAPVANRIPVRIEQLGRVRIDDYQWMKDDNWQAVLRDPSLIKADVREHLEAENAYREAVLASTAPLQEAMFNEMRGRIKEDDSSAPSPYGDWEYYTRFEAGAQHPFYCRRPKGQAEGEQVLLDANALAEGKDYSSVGATSPSPDHRYFVYAEDDQGSEVYKIFIKDLTTGALVGDPIDETVGDFTVSPDSQWLFWTNRDDNGRPDKIFRRPITGGARALVYEEADEGMFMGVSRTSDNAFVIVGIQNQETSESRVIPAADPTATPVLAEARSEGVIYDLNHWGDRWIIRTNADGAVDFKVCEAPTATPDKANWSDIIPFTAGKIIEGVGLFQNWLVRQERADANTRIVVRDRAGAEHAIAVDEPAYALGMQGSYEFATDTLRYTYNSMARPTETWDYDMASRERTLRKTQEIPSGHNPDDYVVERMEAPHADGAMVPISILRRRDTATDGSAPVLLYGYGSYGIPMSAGFSANRLSLVDRGFIYAIAHIRGGSDKGWNWFLAARRMTKKKTFEDFIACAEHLISVGYATAGNIVAQGGSAGGMLMGAINNMRPDLWAGVLANVPFVDVINTMSDTSLPLTPPEWPEWGNPIEDPEAYDYMLSYSPYDQVQAKAYPAILATGGLSDPRVTYWEPEKWVARLRPATTSGKPVLLKINMTAGHFASSGRFDYLRDIAHDYAFCVWASQRGWES